MSVKEQAMKNKIELGDVFRKFSAEFKRQNKLMPSQLKAIDDISKCMTIDMGGGHYHCSKCDKYFWSYHGCRNRSCPKCHGRQIKEWLDKRQAEVLPCQYFHVVATVPHELNKIFSGKQKIMYGVLMKASADALKELAADKTYVGAEIGILSVLHTWTSTLQYHPHVHMLATGGGLDKDGATWHETPYKFLVPVKKLSPLISKKFSEILEKKHPDIHEKIEPKIWESKWCSYCKHYGDGGDVVMKYLARYAFRVAITNARILEMNDKNIIFRYKDNSTGKFKTQEISGIEFMRRFMFHILPKGFHKVRYYGLWSPARRKQQQAAKLGLELLNLNRQIKNIKEGGILDVLEVDLQNNEQVEYLHSVKCPHCGSHEVELIDGRRRNWRCYEPAA
jgi:Zn finger protein HypA/HybF involved in hydrogenase expression